MRKNQALYKRLVLIDRFLNDILTVVGQMLSGFLIQIIWIDRLSVFQNDVRFLDSRELLLEDGDGVVHAHRNNGAASLVRNLEGTAVEWEET